MSLKMSKIDQLKKDLAAEIKQNELERLRIPNEFEELHKKHLEELKLKEVEKSTTDEMRQIVVLKE